MGTCCSFDQEKYVGKQPMTGDPAGQHGKDDKEEDIDFQIPPKRCFDSAEFLDAIFPHNILGSICNSKNNQGLNKFSAIQILDLIGFLELFGPSGDVQSNFPWLWDKVMQEYFSSRQDLKDSINMNSDEDMDFVIRTLVQFQSIAREEFLLRSRQNIDDFLETVYS